MSIAARSTREVQKTYSEFLPTVAVPFNPGPSIADEMRALYLASSYPAAQREASIAERIAAGDSVQRIRDWLTYDYPLVGDAMPSIPILTSVSAKPVEAQVSLLKELGKIGNTIVKGVAGFAAGGPVGAAVAVASTLTSRTSPAAAMPSLSGKLAGLGSLGSVLTKAGAGTLTTMAGTALGTALGTGLTSSSCGCNGSSGRDPCTHNKLSSQRAPDATFFGGCCPPGRRLIRRPWARDICGKIPKMNPFNPRALARADSRLTQFARRSTVMLKDMGFDVSHHRKVKIGKKRRRR